MATSESTRSAWVFLPPVTGLAAAAWFSWEICPLSSPKSMTALVSEAIIYVFAAPLICVFLSWYLYKKIPAGEGFDVGRVLRQSAVVAVLFPPTVLLSLQRSGWFIFLTALMLLGIGGLIGMPRPPLVQRAQIEPGGREMFKMPEPRSPFVQFGPSSAGALCLQLSLLAYTVNERFMTAALLCVAALLLSGFRSEGLRKRYSSQAMTWKMALSGSLAVVLTIAVLLHWYVMRQPVTPDSWANIIVRIIFPDEPKRPHPVEKAPRPPDNESYGSGGLYSGVILWETEPRAVTLAPPLPELYPQTLQDKPVGIPFSGYYSFFKPPLHRAPRSSTRMRGTPARIGLRSSDDYPILMEAHQDFANLVDLACCSSVQLVIRNAEPHTDLVHCEMLLGDTSMPADAALSLGSEMVRAGSRDSLAERTQVLTFTVPRSGAHRRFNEITIRYHLAGGHAASSAHVAIEKFIFVP